MRRPRTVLERVPAAKATWQPHPKSWPLGHLAMHLANLRHWTAIALRETEFDVDPPAGGPAPRRVFEAVANMLEAFDERVRAARAAIVATSDVDFMVRWTLKHGGHTVLTVPRVAVPRSVVMNHMIHHRGQLTVYLRQCDVPLPEVYGPTADSGG